MMLIDGLEDIHIAYFLGWFAGLYMGFTVYVCGKLIEKYKSRREGE